jgi:hypothetical protein
MTEKVLHPVATGVRTPQEQLARLDKGGYAAKRERAKLKQRIEDAAAMAVAKTKK